MGGETNKIAEIANKVQKEIFAIFGWEQRGPADQNWPCVKDHVHPDKLPAAVAGQGSEESDPSPPGGELKTHPSDLVLRYDDPYSFSASYLTVDLKSYAAASITKASLSKALKSLCRSTDCANLSPGWSHMYVSGDASWRAHGMLFLYNHDGEYDGEQFSTLLASVTPANLRIGEKQRVYVLGPGEISHLQCVSRDVKVIRGEDRTIEQVLWFTPDLVMKKTRSKTFGICAPPEVLLGPWQIAGILRSGQTMPQALRLYYRCRKPPTSDELEYLIEFLFRHHLVDLDLTVVFVGKCGDAQAVFDTARHNIVEGLYDNIDIRNRLKPIRVEVSSEFERRFSPVNIGMERAQR